MRPRSSIFDLRFSILLLLLAAPILFADAGWMLTTADFRQQPVALHAIDKTSVRISPVGSQTISSIPFDQFLQLDRSSRSRQGTGAFILHLSGGARILGQPTAYQDEQVIWNNPIIGEFKVSLKDARALVRSGKLADHIDDPRTEDLVQMSNGDTAKGILTDISAKAVKINSGANDLELALDNIDCIYFAAAGKPKQQGDRSFRVRLLDGSIFTATSVELNSDTLLMTLSPTDQRKVPLESIDGIEQLNGPVSWLSSRIPEQIVQIPYFGATVWPTRMDTTVGGRPIQFANQIFARGIGVHSYSRIDYALDGSYEAFRTQYAIAADERRQYADVTVLIKLDGKVVHEHPNLRADILAPVTIIDLPKTAKMLTLEVDYGAANDTQDRFNWIEPALLRKKPPPPPAPPPPATRPATRPLTTAPTTQPK
jgi:NPCBM/NEW2 domain-containing protein